MTLQTENTGRFKVELRDESVILIDLRGPEEFVFPLSDVKVVGESTNQNGPYTEDWFLCLCRESDWMEIPVESIDFSLIMEALASLLGFEPKLSLGSSTDFKSRVLWPRSLENTPLFEYQSNWYKLNVCQTYSSFVQDFLSSHSSNVK